MTVPKVPAEGDPRRCVAHSSRTGLPCKKWAIRGGTVCATHGGRSPAVRNAARRRLEQRRIESEMGKLLVELEVENLARPAHEILLEQLARAQSMVDLLGVKVAELGESELYGPDHLGDGKPHVVVVMYDLWVDRSARIAKVCMELGIEERRLAIAEAQGRRLGQIMQRQVQLLFELLAQHGVEADYLEMVRRKDVPRLMRQAIVETSGSEAP